MKFVYYKSLHWLGLNYRLIPFITGFIISVFNIVLNNSDVFCMWDSWFTSSGPTEEAAGETLKWAQFTQLVCNKKR